jgi:hypothetical protein
VILSVRRKSYAELAESLDKDAKIIVLSCNNCAKKCLGLGGRVGLAALADKLDRDGFNVIRRELIGFACSVDLVGKRAVEDATKQWFAEADVILTLACEDGEIAVKNAFPEAQVPSLNQTLGIGWGSPQCGVRLTHTLSGIDLDIPLPEGMPLAEAAEKLGFESGSF